MMQHPDSSSQTSVNLDDFLLRVGNDHNLACELIMIFKEKYPLLLHLLKESVTCVDCKRVEATSHMLAGMLSCLSATRAAALACRLELMGHEGKSSGMTEVLTIFEEDVANLLVELDGYVTQGVL
jgi:hypothetical protein